MISISTSKKNQFILPFNFFSSPLCLDLPPPPEPPPEEIPLEVPHGFTEASIMANGALSSLERSEYSNSQQRKGSGQRHGDSKTRLCTVLCCKQSVITARAFFILPSSLHQTVDDNVWKRSVAASPTEFYLSVNPHFASAWCYCSTLREPHCLSPSSLLLQMRRWWRTAVRRVTFLGVRCQVTAQPQEAPHLEAPRGPEDSTRPENTAR